MLALLTNQCHSPSWKNFTQQINGPKMNEWPSFLAVDRGCVVVRLLAEPTGWMRKMHNAARLNNCTWPACLRGVIASKSIQLQSNQANITSTWSICCTPSQWRCLMGRYSGSLFCTALHRHRRPFNRIDVSCISMALESGNAWMVTRKTWPTSEWVNEREKKQRQQ